MSVKAKNVQTWVKIPAQYTEEERKAIALEILNFIRERSAQGVDVNGSSFKGYSKEYMKSLDFKNAGKGRTPNLQLSGDMLAAIKLLDSERGRIKIGYDTSDSEAGRAEGNQIGSYGQPSGDKSKARPFIGINPKHLKKILEAFPLNDEDKRQESTDNALAADYASTDTVDELFGGDDG